MNGRVYDPQIGRFVSADPFVQFPDQTQSANRYSYVFNNPLAWTDPSGYLGYREERWLRVAVAVVISWYTGGAASGAIQAGGAAGWSTAAGWAAVGGFAAGAVSTGTFKGGVQGALTALAFYGVGAGLGAMEIAADNWQAAAAHGVTGGVLAELQGGKFAHGFLSAGANKAVHSRLPTDMHPALGGMVSAIVGGTVSEVSGGKFANGAITAAMAYAFNQLSSALRRQGYHDVGDGLVARIDRFSHGGQSGFEITVYEDSREFRKLAERGSWDELRGSRHEKGTFNNEGFLPKHGVRQRPALGALTERQISLLANAESTASGLRFTWDRQVQNVRPTRQFLQTAGSLLRRAGIAGLAAGSLFDPSPDKACRMGLAHANGLGKELCP